MQFRNAEMIRDTKGIQSKAEQHVHSHESRPRTQSRAASLLEVSSVGLEEAGFALSEEHGEALEHGTPSFGIRAPESSLGPAYGEGQLIEFQAHRSTP